MRTISQPAVITPAIIGLALLAVAIVFIGMTGRKVLINKLIDHSYNLTILPKIELCNP